MKFCPYCGSDLFDDESAFCVECGGPLHRKVKGEKASIKKKANKGNEGKAPTVQSKKTNRASAKTQSDRVEDRGRTKKKANSDGYDGYYADVVPTDISRETKAIDRELIKKIAIIAGSMLLIVGLCVLALFLL